MRKIWLQVFGVFAILFVVLQLALPELSWSWIIKTVPALALAVFVLKNGLHLPARLTALGLVFSAGGDAALGIDREALFVYGLGFFLVAHLFYCVAFARNLRSQPRRRLPAVTLLLTFALVVLYLLLPRLGALTVPVMVYVSIISLMGLLALLRKGPFFPVAAGALLFMLSDTLIAVDKFELAGIPFASTGIMVTYYLGQLFIALGIARPLPR